jgi:hypothetical protein
MSIAHHNSSIFQIFPSDKRLQKNDQLAKHINLPHIFLWLVIKLKVEAKFTDTDLTSLHILPYNRIRFAEELI